MTIYDLDELTTAIQIVLDEIRPTSTQARVLETIINHASNGLPRFTYDLAEFKCSIEVPNIWCAIGYDLAPFDKDWDCIKWADENQKSVRNAVYGLQSQFADLANKEVESFALYLFSDKGGRDIDVVTFDPDYKGSREKCSGRASKRVASSVKATSKRFTIMGKDRQQVARQLVETLRPALFEAGLSRNILISEIESIDEQEGQA